MLGKSDNTLEANDFKQFCEDVNRKLLGYK
jgi:hypothetical protein